VSAQVAVGLNPYGLTYTLGLQGMGTARANLHATGLEGFLAVADEIGARVIEFHDPWLRELDAAGLAALKERVAGLGAVPVVSAALEWTPAERALENAVALGARVVRMGISPVLCGDRNAFGAARWAQQIATIRAELPRLAGIAAGKGLTVAIENHQDFGSAELVAFCEEAGDNVGITIDTGNAFPVAESPLAFARTVAPRVRHVHLKDYRVQFTEEGYRLVRCAIGDGAVPVREVLGILLAEGRDLTASLEPGALEARHVRLFTGDWWRGYAPKDARDVAAALLAAQVNRLPEGTDHRTPWEREAPGEELIAYERDMMLRSAANMRALGLME
jgi:sugar phosphate isomerase/epimerase